MLRCCRICRSGRIWNEPVACQPSRYQHHRHWRETSANRPERIYRAWMPDHWRCHYRARDEHLRAEVNRVVIGARSNVQDGSIVHCDGPMPGVPDGFPTIIGDDVLIGHMAVVHGCILHNRAFIGMSATVMNGCVVESDAMLGAGGLLTPGKRIDARQLWAGTPARFVRELDDAAIMGMQIGVAHYVENAKRHKAALEAD
jgi:gamma-carbonic anhydrase